MRDALSIPPPARLAAALLLAASLAGCGPLPRPFQPERKAVNPLLLLEDRSGIVVAPLARGALGQRGSAADAMAAALRELHVPASTDAGNRDSHWLLGRAEVAALPGDREAVRLGWELYGPDGRRIAVTSHRLDLPAGRWARPSPDLLHRAVAPTARNIAALLQGAAPTAAGSHGVAPGARLAVQPMQAGPEGARRLLPPALAAALRAQGLPVAEHTRGGDILVHGAVELGPPAAGGRQVAVRWRLLRRGGGEELARLEQANRVPAALLDDGWERLAPQIARAAAQGIAEALKRADAAP